MSSFWDQRLGAVIYSTLSETPLPGGQGDSVHANADNSLLSGIWNVDHSSGSVALTQGGERGAKLEFLKCPAPPTSQPLAPVIFSAMKLKMSLY